MEITLAREHAYHFVPQVSLEVARDRVEQKKNNLVAGMVGALLSRPKPEEIQLVSQEQRLEPFWQIAVHARTRYERRRDFGLPVSGPEVTHITAFGEELPVTRGERGPTVIVAGVEHCTVEQRLSRSVDGLTGQPADLTKYLSLPKTEITDLGAFAPEGVLVVPPQVRASAVVRQALSEVVKPVQNAQIIHEERVEVEAIDLNLRPVYAFEYEWAAKSKRSVIEFDPLTGEIRAGGKALSRQFSQLKDAMLNRDLLFDVTADAVGMIVPGGSIAVKLVKAVVDRGK